MQSQHPAMVKEELNSDRINYLIWRYLQDANYLSTAVKLQADWDMADPQSLPFAPHVEDRALERLLQRGLLYNDGQAQAARNGRIPRSANARGFFGPVPPLSPPLAAEEDPINARKRTSEERPQHSRQASPAKRAKLSNGYENGVVEPTPMDLDEQDTTDANSINGHVYPSPEEIEFDHHQPPPITNGPEKATQAEKPRDLTPESLTVSLVDQVTKVEPRIFKAQWNPQDSDNLIALGLDMAPRSYKVAVQKDSATDFRNRLIAEHSGLPINKDTVNGTLTFASWASDGETIAVASDCGDKGSVTIIASKEGQVKRTFPLSNHPSIILLRWNVTNQFVLALTSPAIDGSGSWVSIFDTFTGKIVELQLPRASEDLDAVWTKEGGFAICDGETLIQYEHGAESINKVGEFPESGSPHVLEYDPASGFLATAAESGKVTVWNSDEKHLELQAHDGQVTTLKWQPAANGTAILATAGEDQTVKLWNVGPEKSHKPLQIMDLGSSVLGLSFTPRGDFLAAASNSHVAIYDMVGSATPTVPVATWMKGKQVGWQSPKQTNGHIPEEDTHVLEWDPQGTKLVLGVHSMLTFIPFNPAQVVVNGHS